MKKADIAAIGNYIINTLSLNTLGTASASTVAAAIAALNSNHMISATQIPSGTDLNNVTTPGFYYNSTGYSFSHMPANYTGHFTLIVLDKGMANSNVLRNQILLCNNQELYYRTKFSTAWQPWYKVTATQI